VSNDDASEGRAAPRSDSGLDDIDISGGTRVDAGDAGIGR